MNQEILQKGLAALGGRATPNQLRQLAEYAALLRDWNRNINLTAITDPTDITVKHYLDSLLPLYYLDFPQGAALADIGTGAGFPGLPIKILRPDLQLTLVDALQKRVRFLETVCQQLELTQVRCIHGRAEELGKTPAHRERYDTVVSRAVADLKILGEYCLPFVKVGGRLVALKSESVQEELDAARPMLGTLGGRVEQVIDAPLPESEIRRRLVVIKKERPTPPQYPRRANKIKK